MAISDLAQAVDDQVPWRTCSVCHALTTLPAKEAQALRSLLSNPSVRYSELSAALATDPDYPLKLTGAALGRHVRGDCEAHERLRA